MKSCRCLIAVAGLTLTLNVMADPLPFPQKDIIEGQYIVTLKSRHAPGTVATAMGIKTIFTYEKAINGFAAILPEEVLTQLKKDSRVLSIEPDKIIRANAVTWG